MNVPGTSQLTQRHFEVRGGSVFLRGRFLLFGFTACERRDSRDSWSPSLVGGRSRGPEVRTLSK